MAKKPSRNNPLSYKELRAMFVRKANEILSQHEMPIRRTTPKNLGEQYSVKMTEAQRKSILHGTRVKNAIKTRLKSAATGTQTIAFNRKELNHLSEELAEAACFVPSADKKRLLAVKQKIDAHLTAELAPVFEHSFEPKRTSPLVFQFKITLLDIKPSIWRRIQMTEGTLADLHECIQGAFGWWDAHLHQFKVDGERYAPTLPSGYEPIEGTLPEEGVFLSDIVPKNGQPKRWLYEYDFGDGWRHEVLFEGHPKPEKKRAYPWCVEGERACPPEDCGGPFMFAEYLEAITDPNHEQHEELLAWRGPFDPEAFDVKKATRVMRRRQRV